MGSAYAQQPADNSAEEEEEDIIETVVVLGVRSSLQKSLDMKRLTSAHTDVITSEDDDVVPFTQGGLPLAWSKYGTRVTLGLSYRCGG